MRGLLPPRFPLLLYLGRARGYCGVAGGLHLISIILTVTTVFLLVNERAELVASMTLQSPPIGAQRWRGTWSGSKAPGARI